MTNIQEEAEAIRDFELVLANLHKNDMSARIKRALAQKVKVVAYARVASDTQQEVSMGNQIAALREYAKKNNLWIVAIYKDYCSTKAPVRPGLSRLMQKILQGRTQKILCWNLDRISRDYKEMVLLNEFFKKKGVEIVTP